MVITQPGKEGNTATSHHISRKKPGPLTSRPHDGFRFNKDLENSIESPKPNKRSTSPMADVLCRACDQPIMGLIVQALGETWHQDHFLCSECKKPISSNRFNIEQGKPYCEEDYANLFLKKCFGCKAPIRDVVVVALNQTWHRDHFVCTMCATKLASKGFFERENNPFCQPCYEEKFCPKCNECDNPITDTAVMALGKKWHQECFTCQSCRKPVMDSTFEVITNQPMCSQCIMLMSNDITY